MRVDQSELNVWEGGGGREHLAPGPAPTLKTDSPLTNPTSCEQSRQIRPDLTQKIQQLLEQSDNELNGGLYILTETSYIRAPYQFFLYI